MVLFLFLSHLAIGIAFTLVFVSREAGVKFFRFNTGLAALLIVAAFAFRPPEASIDQAGKLAFGALVIFEASLVLYWLTVGRVLASIRPFIVGTSVAAGALALFAQAMSLSGSVPSQVMTVLSFFSSAFLLGGACTAMILGHWYLVIPSLQVSHLQSIV